MHNVLSGLKIRIWNLLDQPASMDIHHLNSHVIRKIPHKS